MKDVPRHAPLILALDAGGTSTRCLLARSDGTVLGRGRAGPGNHILCGWDTAHAAIAAAVAEACAASNVVLEAVDRVVVGSAGIGPNGEGKSVIEGLLAELFPSANVHATGDMVAAFWGALPTDWGVVVAAGTGSVCYGRNAAGDTRQIGGWGHILGDEGSAYDIAVHALRAAARASDGRGPRTTLVERLTAALEVDTFIEVALRIYAEPMSRDAIAALAAIVTQAAAAGDALAGRLLAEAGTELGLAAVTALRLLKLADSPTPIAHTGALFDAGDAVLNAFRSTIAAACPRGVVVAAEFPPVIGALKLALRQLGIAFSPAIAARLRATLGEEPQ